MTYQNVRVNREEPIAIVAIDHPPANALDQATLGELNDVLDAIEADVDVRAMVVTGAGERFFVAGADINEFARPRSGEGGTFLSLGNALFHRIERLPKPVIAAVNGYALGGGCELAMACDLRIAAERAQFGQPEINLGLIPGWGGLQRLPRLIGRAKALELLLTGDRLTAADALRCGLVNKVVPDAELMVQATDLARRLALQAPLAIAQTNWSIADGADEPLDRAIAADEEAFAVLLRTEDAREGIAAFLEKRKAHFKGR